MINLTNEELELLDNLPEKERVEALRQIAGGSLPAYVFGKKYFYRNYFYINEACLIPRPDTERVVETVVSRLPRFTPSTFADLCTGCGCIALSVLEERTKASCQMVEISQRALEAAALNIKALGLDSRTTLTECDILKSDPLGDCIFDVIVSNPPYLRSEEIADFPDLAAEPYIAFDGGSDGMTFYKRIIMAFSSHLSKDGSFVFEIGYEQGMQIKALANERDFNCTVTKDYGGNDRVALLTRK